VTAPPRLGPAGPATLQKASGRDGEHERQRRNQNYKQYEAHCIPPCVKGRRLGWTGFAVGMLKSLRSSALLYMGKLEVPEGIRVPRSMVTLRQARQARNRLSTVPIRDSRIRLSQVSQLSDAGWNPLLRVFVARCCLAPKRRLEATYQVPLIEGLAQKADRACIEHTPSELFLREGSYEYDRRVDTLRNQ
jgi:hypothetical protein